MATTANSRAMRTYRVLSLDGGGMRGTYAATYLNRVSEAFARRRQIDAIDLGKAFDLITGTSTGGIIACALAAGVDLADVVDLYRQHGAAIFPRRIPRGAVGVAKDLRLRPAALKAGATALKEALERVLKDVTLGDIFEKRGISLAIPAVEMSRHRSWVFKTPHILNTSHRDDDYRLVDICMATTAAPIFRAMAAVDHPDNKSDGYHVFVDGGLWANNPVLVGLIDALEVTKPDERIEVFCLGTCPVPAGEQISRTALERGLLEWKFGGEAANLSIDAQAFAFDNMARMLARHVKRDCRVIRFPADKVPAALLPYLDLDDVRPEAMAALVNQARTDADMTNSRCGRSDDLDGQLICGLFASAPPRPNADHEIQGE